MSADYTFPQQLTQRWLALAQRRKEHLLDLYQSGRWQRYYSERDFALRLREAIHAVDQWSATAQSKQRADHPPDDPEMWAPPTQPADEAAAREETVTDRDAEHDPQEQDVFAMPVSEKEFLAAE